MVASFAVIHSSGYYTRQSEALSYYVDKEAAGTWLRGHESLGVAAGDIVDAGAFDRICAGLDVKGKALSRGAPGTRMLGVDITLSSPKSLSVLWAVALPELRERIAEAERIAVDAALRLVEREIPLARRGHQGTIREQAHFVAAVFTHSESRPEAHADGAVFSDPQRHHHVCIPNLAQRDDGSWGAIDSINLRRWKKAIGAAYRLELASALQERGFAIEQAEDDWKWSIAGVPEAVSRYFSARRASLEEELAQAGMTSAEAPALAAAINATERGAKIEMDIESLTERWRSAVLGLGVSPEQIVNKALEAGSLLELGAVRQGPGIAMRLAAIPETLSEHQSTFQRRELIEATANGLVGSGASLDDVIAGADRLVAEDRILERAITRDGPVYTTPEILAAEKALVALVRRNARARVAGPALTPDDRHLVDSGLNEEQQEVVRAATSGARMTLVQGGAGTGKSTTLKTIADAWQSSGYQVFGAAVAWRAANNLATDLGIEARAIDAWIKAIDQGAAPFVGRACLIVEEGGLQSTPQALRLLNAMDRAGGVVVMVGDENQLRPVGAGHAMRLIRETIGAIQIDTVIRQREVWAREAPGAFARGDARQALDAFADRGLVRFEDGARQTIEAIADRWQQVARDAPEERVLVTAKTNAEVRALSAAIRNRLREQGALIGPDVALEAADASGNRHVLHLAAGDHIRFLRRNDAFQVVNGSEAIIRDIRTDRAGTVQIRAEQDGRPFTFTPADIADSKGRVRLAHGYAATLFQAQGLTVEHSLVLVSSRLDRHDAYVASSRARGETEFFIDSRALDREIEQNEEARLGQDREAQRREYLASCLSRESVKTNALDFEAGRQRDRQREYAHEL